jgi:hypothetical protein
MPYFKTVEGVFTQLCVYAVQEEPCPDPNCKLAHDPKERRVCPMFHDPKERCPHRPCLLGHHEAREAFRAQKALARCKRLTKAHTEDVTETTNTTEQGADKGGTTTAPQTLIVNPNLTVPETNPIPNLLIAQPPSNQPTEQDKGKAANPVNFQDLVKESAKTGQQDEIKRLCQVTENLRVELEELNQATADKENQVRTMQTAMDEVQAENTNLKAEIESEPSVLDLFYRDVFEKQSNNKILIDLNRTPPSEKAMDGALTILKTMFAKPVEFMGELRNTNLFENRPETRFSQEVQTLQSLGLSAQNMEHAFFIRCYILFPTDPSFCSDGIHDNASTVASLLPGGAFAPRALALKKTPKKFHKLFFVQASSKKTTNVQNSSLNLKNAWGIRYFRKSSFRSARPYEKVHL